MLVGDVDNREAMHMWRQEVYAKSLYVSILCEPKTNIFLSL